MGYETARALAARGFDLAVVARSRDRLSAAAERIAAETGLDALVNNAGISVQGPLELVPLHALRRQFEVNVIGQMAVTQAFLPLVRRAGGTIVNMGAASGRVTFPMLGPISASKTALESIADDERLALADMLTRVMEPYLAGRQEPPRRRSR